MIKELKIGFGAGAAILIGISAWMAAYPSYRVYSAKMRGEAELEAINTLNSSEGMIRENCP